MSPHAVPVTLTAAERTTLDRRVRRAKTAHRDRVRALIVLAAAAGRGNAAIAGGLGVTADTGRNRNNVVGSPCRRRPGNSASSTIDGRAIPTQARMIWKPSVAAICARSGTTFAGGWTERSEEHTSELQ